MTTSATLTPVATDRHHANRSAPAIMWARLPRLKVALCPARRGRDFYVCLAAERIRFNILSPKTGNRIASERREPFECSETVKGHEVPPLPKHFAAVPSEEIAWWRDVGWWSSSFRRLNPAAVGDGRRLRAGRHRRSAFASG